MKVEIWSDIVCPWCYIGKRRFERGLAEFEHRDDVEIVWRSFQLDPSGRNDEDESVSAMLARRKGISLAQAQAMNRQVSEVAATEGLAFDLDEAKWGNTFDAHRLVHLAAAHGLQAEAEERLMRAYFTERRSIGARETLVELATEIGLDATEARTTLESDRFATEVRDDLRRAASFGIQGVPFFVIDERYGLSGAQPPELFVDTLRRAWTESHPLETIAGAGDAACGPDGCEVPG